jgi:hypothetical protein
MKRNKLIIGFGIALFIVIASGTVNAMMMGGMGYGRTGWSYGMGGMSGMGGMGYGMGYGMDAPGGYGQNPYYGGCSMMGDYGYGPYGYGSGYGDERHPVYGNYIPGINVPQKSTLSNIFSFFRMGL